MLVLICAYGITFWLMNKAKFLHNRIAFFDAMFKCSFCTGFHAGWVSWFLFQYASEGTLCNQLHELLGAITCGFASAAFCYIIDTLTQLFEKYLFAK